MAHLVATRFVPVLHAGWLEGPAAPGAAERARLEALGVTDTTRRPCVPDLLALAPTGEELDRCWAFAGPEDVHAFLDRALRRAGLPAAFPRGRWLGSDPPGRELAAILEADPGDRIRSLGRWLAVHGPASPGRAAVARVLLGDALHRAGRRAEADACWQAVVREAPDHPIRHRAAFNLLNFDLWPIPHHPALDAPPRAADRHPIRVPDPAARRRHLAALRDRPGVRWLAGGHLPFVPVPGGTFHMGTDRPRFAREGPRRRVVLSRTTWIAAWPVTRGAWRLLRPDRWGEEGSAPEEPDLPALGISWDEATAYLDDLSEREGVALRLPTEAEWTRAAGGEGDAPWPWGDASPEGRCNLFGPRELPVACYPPNRWGLFDVVGNGLEWVADCWREDALARWPDGVVDPIEREPAPGDEDLRTQRSMVPAPIDLVRWIGHLASRTYGLRDQAFGGRGFRAVIAEASGPA